jgi:hypothetical protein
LVFEHDSQVDACHLGSWTLRISPDILSYLTYPDLSSSPGYIQRISPAYKSRGYPTVRYPKDGSTDKFHR